MISQGSQLVVGRPLTRSRSSSCCSSSRIRLHACACACTHARIHLSLSLSLSLSALLLAPTACDRDCHFAQKSLLLFLHFFCFSFLFLHSIFDREGWRRSERREENHFLLRRRRHGEGRAGSTSGPGSRSKARRTEERLPSTPIPP